MILQSLVHYYEALVQQEKVTKPGWCLAKVAFALELSEAGELLGIMPLKQEVERGKKMVEVPQELIVPQMVSRSSGVSPNFLCDNSSYFLGLDNKGKPIRSIQCFEAAKARHQQILNKDGSLPGAAVLRFFETWQPEQAADHPVIQGYLDEIMAGANLIFSVDGDYVHQDPEVIEAWEHQLRQTEDPVVGTCLVTGTRTEIARTHGTVQGVRGAQSSGAALVSFNAPAFESYGKEQSFNAPVGIYAVYAYTTALSSLLADREHSTIIGDTTVVYWAEDGEQAYQNMFGWCMEPAVDNREKLDEMFKKLEAGEAIIADDVLTELSPDQRFYIMGLAPNAARISVRFFYQDSFGNILKNIKAHYERMKIVCPATDHIQHLGTWRMLQETVNKKSRDKKAQPNLAGAVYRSIISGSRYPGGLYHAVLGRIRAEQDDSDSRTYKITRGRAAIIKAYLLRNTKVEEEELTVALNQESENVAYILGREFAVLEAIQQKANPSLNATIKDRYFNAACATPAMIFPVLFRLKNSHIRKISSEGAKINYEKLLGELQNKIMISNRQETAVPSRLSLEEQGMFILGYYHQTQKRFEKKTEEE